MKSMKRAQRRREVARLKKARQFYFGRDLSGLPAQLGKVVHTAKVCSCWMCGHVRRWVGSTLQEKRQQMAFREELHFLDQDDRTNN